MIDLNENGFKLYKFEYIRDMMIKNIASGNLKAHAKLPSVDHVCESYSLSQVTVRRAYMHLRKRGYISHLPGLGYFVQETAGVLDIEERPAAGNRKPIV